MPSNLLTAISLKAELASALNKLKTSGERQRVNDGGGLSLVVRPSGSSSWVLRYSFRSERRDLTLGSWPVVGLKLARELAEAAKQQVAQGNDPAADDSPAVSVSADSVRQLMEDWLLKEGHGAVYDGNIRAAFVKDVLPAIGFKQPHKVDRADCLAILRTIEGRGSNEMVRRVRMWMRQMFEFGADHEDRPLLTSSPVPMGTLRSFAKHDAGNFPAITDASKVPALMEKIRRCGQTIPRAALLFSAYVFQRPSEIREASWKEFDLDTAKWVIPEGRVGRKGGGEHWVPLSTQAVKLLREHSGVVGTTGLLFPGRRYEKAISEGTLTTSLNAMGYKGLHSPHGFRAMARTIGEEALGIQAKYLEKLLGHEYDPSGLGGAYNRAEYWTGRVEAMQRWADWLEAARP